MKLVLVLISCCNLVFINPQDILITWSIRKQLSISKFDWTFFLINWSLRFNSKFSTRNYNIKTWNLQFCWNLQLLTRYSLLRNEPCPTANLLTVEANTISVALNTSVLLGLWLFIFQNFFWQDRAYFRSSSQN